MICWTVTVFTDDPDTYPIIDANAVPSLTEARLAAGDAAIATLTHLAANTSGALFLSITIDNHTALAGGVTADRSAGGGGVAQLIAAVRQLQRSIGVGHD